MPASLALISVLASVKEYQSHYTINHRPASVAFMHARLAHVTRLLGFAFLPDANESAICGYIKTRLGEGACGRTINMEVGELSRAIGKPWGILWPKARKLEERTDVGKALASDEEVADSRDLRTCGPANRDRQW